MPQNRREPQFLVSRFSAAPRDPPLFVIFAPFCADPLSCDGREIFAHKIAKMTKIWDQRIGASCRTDASMQARAAIAVSKYLIKRELDIEESVKVGAVRRHRWKVATQGRDAEIGAIKDSVRFLRRGVSCSQ